MDTVHGYEDMERTFWLPRAEAELTKAACCIDVRKEGLPCEK
jgi:hypothetical protein